MKKTKMFLAASILSVSFLAGIACFNGTSVQAATIEKEATLIVKPKDVSTPQTDVATPQKDISASQKDVTTPQGDGIVHLYIVRHGKTMLNTTDRVQGWSDAVLTKAGEDVVAQAGKGMAKKGIQFVAAYSSDSGRSMQTAQILLDKLGQKNLQLKTDWRLREFNFGTYEGDLNHTMWGEIAEKQGKTLEEWMAAGISPKDFANSVAELDKGKDLEGLNWPAENYATITTRLKKGLDAISEEVSKQGGGNVLVVSHGLSIGGMMDILQDGYEMPMGGIKNAAVCTVDYKDGVYTVVKINDVSYIEAGK